MPTSGSEEKATYDEKDFDAVLNSALSVPGSPPELSIDSQINELENAE